MANGRNTMTDLVQVEYESFRRSPDWELRNIRKALNLMPFLNTPEQTARLEAVKRIQTERKARR
jgi:hypothetical protein